MIKNFSDCGFLQDGGDDFQGSTTVRAVFDIDIKQLGAAKINNLRYVLTATSGYGEMPALGL